jgi:hypothetical protein
MKKYGVRMFINVQNYGVYPVPYTGSYTETYFQV